MADPVVLLPGMVCSARQWGDLPARIGEVTGREVLVHVPSGPSMTEGLDALRRELPDRAVVVGLSLGAIVAMALTRTAPERVGGLVLMATSARPPTPEQQVAWSAAVTELEAGRSTARGFQEDLLPMLLSEQALQDPALVATTVDMADDVGTAGIIDQLRMQSTRVDERGALAEVAVPTLVLAGECDVLCPLDRHEEITARVRGSRLQVVPGAGHLVSLERPEVVASAVLALLDEVG